MRRERRRKFFFNPQTMLHLEYSLRTEKKTPQHKSTYTINTWHCNRGNISSSGKQPSGPVPCGAGLRPARPSGGTKHFRGSWMGEGSNVCNGGREQESPHCIALSGWWNQTALAKALVRGQKDKIKLLWLLGRTAAKFPQLILFVHSDLWNHQISLPKQRVSSWWYPYSGL